jgi:anti-sigma regulatory factor (Ser/Thr protein kinase)
MAPETPANGLGTTLTVFRRRDRRQSLARPGGGVEVKTTTAVKPFLQSLEPDPRALSDLRQEISEWLREAGVGEEAQQAVAAATHEAAAGAIERTAFVRVRGSIDRHAVTMVVEGEGEWDALDEDVGGLRLDLLRRLVTDTAVEHSEGTTSLRLQRRL